jgi:molybdopterin converting factor small subunit
MPKINLELPSWITAKLNGNTSGRGIIEREILEGATVNDFLTDLATTYPGFRKAVYNPDTGSVTEQLSLVLNGRLLTFREILETTLSQGDTIVLIPIYSGG